MNLLVIRQKTESQNKCYKKTKASKFSEKQTFLPPNTHMPVYISGDKKCYFPGKFGTFYFLITPIRKFNLLHYY